MVENDWCMSGLVVDTGLTERKFRRKSWWGVWNGKQFLVQHKESQERFSWWYFIKNIWHYGLSPWKLSQLVSETSEQFKWFALSVSLIDGILSEFGSKDLDPNLLKSAKEYLDGIGMSQHFKSEVIEPRTRLAMGRDLTGLTGLDMVLGMAEGKRKALLRGNYQLIDRLFRLSDVTLRLNFRIKSVVRGQSRRYHLLPDSNQKQDHYSDELEFDVMITATPLQSNDITFDGLESATVQQPLTTYAKRHVTHFASTDRLTPHFFNNTSLPELFRPRKALTPSTSATPGTNSSCDSREMDNVYHILFVNPISNSTILSLLGKNPSSTSNLDNLGLHWNQMEIWKHATPIYQKQSQFLDDVEIAPFLFYTSGAEELYTSLEMNCRMGKNVGMEVYRRQTEPYNGHTKL